MNNRKIVTFGIIFLLSLVFLCSFFVRADSAPPFDYSSYYGRFFWGTIFIFITINFIINLFFYSFLLFILLNLLKKPGKITNNRMSFFLRLIVGVGVITIIGAYIDILLLYELRGGAYHLTFNNVNWSLAALYVFISILITSVITIRPHWKISVLLSGAIAVINFLSWWIIITIGFELYGFVCRLSFIMFLVLIPLVLLLLRKWHTKQYAK